MSKKTIESEKQLKIQFPFLPFPGKEIIPDRIGSPGSWFRITVGGIIRLQLQTAAQKPVADHWDGKSFRMRSPDV
jgi:hypothetical protein